MLHRPIHRSSAEIGLRKSLVISGTLIERKRNLRIRKMYDGWMDGRHCCADYAAFFSSVDPTSWHCGSEAAPELWRQMSSHRDFFLVVIYHTVYWPRFGVQCIQPPVWRQRTLFESPK